MTVLRTSIRPRIDWVYDRSARLELPLWGSPLRARADDSACWVGYHSRLEPELTLDDQCHSSCSMSGRYIIRCRAHGASTSVSECLTGWWTMTSLCPSDIITDIHFSVSAAIYPHWYTDDIYPSYSQKRPYQTTHTSRTKSRGLHLLGRSEGETDPLLDRMGSTRDLVLLVCVV
jgi:hypothetical protein